MLKYNFMQLIKICGLKAKPQDLQYSLVTLCTVIFMNLLIFAYSMGNVLGYVKGTIIALTFVVVVMAYIFLILKAFKLKARFVQTTTTILGCSALLIFLGFMISVILLLLLNLGVSGQILTGISNFLNVSIFLWTIVICAFIYKHALDKGWLMGVMNTILMLVFSNIATIVIRRLMG